MRLRSENEYIEAARIISTCKAERLPVVIDLLQKGGIDFSDALIQSTMNKRESIESLVSHSSRDARADRYKGRWLDTDDPIIITLRKAYIDGYKVSDIASAAGITRTALYDYMRGQRNYSPRIAQAFISAYSQLSIHYPPDSDH